MVKRENIWRQWPVAVAVSIVLHGAVVIGLNLIPGRPTVEVRADTHAQVISFANLDESEESEVHFEGPREENHKPISKPSNNKPEKVKDASEYVSTLRDPWVNAPTNSNQSSSESGKGVGNGGKATTSFFDVETRGQFIVYVVDGSGSMGKHGELTTACRELQASISQLPGSARFQIIIYNSDPNFLLPRFQGWLEPTPAILKEVDADLARQVAEGRTNHEAALRKAFYLRPDVVYFLTDADDLTPDHVRLVNHLNKDRAVLNTIELNTLHQGRTDMPMQTLARDNGGTYRAVDLDR